MPKKTRIFWFLQAIISVFAICSGLYGSGRPPAVPDTTESEYNQYDFYNPLYAGSYYPYNNKYQLTYNPQKPFWIPVAEAVGFNLTLGAFNRFVLESEFSKISWQSIKDNFAGGFKWDADGLITNMWAHPFQGSIYFNSSRSAGYGYWPSMGIAALGSFQWEFFMENEPPAINDFIMTTLAGAMYGEVFYRLSDMLLDDRSSGTERFFREFGAGIFNPGRLFNRLVFGRTSRHTEDQIYPRQRYFGMVYFGITNVASGLSFREGIKNDFVVMHYTYGEPFYRSIKRPFGFFRFYSLFNLGGVQPALGQFRIYGLVFSKRKSFSNGNQMLWGFFQNTDYLNNNVYEIGGVSFGPGIGFRTPRKKPFQFAAILNGSFMPMGAANSDYAPGFDVGELDSARTYNMGMGMQAKLDLNFKFPYGQLFIVQTFWWVHTLDGAPGDEYIGVLQPLLIIHIYKRLHIGFEYLIYHRRGRYRDFPDINLRNYEKRLFIAFRF